MTLIFIRQLDWPTSWQQYWFIDYT